MKIYSHQRARKLLLIVFQGSFKLQLAMSGRSSTDCLLAAKALLAGMCAGVELPFTPHG